MPLPSRINISMPPEQEAALNAIAAIRHGGNRSATLQAALDAYIREQALYDVLIPQLMATIYAAVQPDERYDPADDERVVAPATELAGMVGLSIANAIISGLRQLAQEHEYGNR